MDWAQLRMKALEATKKAVAASVGDDQLITQAISAIEDADKAANTLAKRLREWYEHVSPEFSKNVSDNEAFTRLIQVKSKQEQLAELKLQETMGADLAAADEAEILHLAATISAIYVQRSQLESYLTTVMQRHCPNVLALTGTTIGARLLREARSLRRMATIQASTIQLYGAEKALFRHLKTGAKPPKHGYIVNHPLVANNKEKGKVSRALADKIAIAAKVDFFKGEFIGEKLRKELEERFA